MGFPVCLGVRTHHFDPFSSITVLKCDCQLTQQHAYEVVARHRGPCHKGRHCGKVALAKQLLAEQCATDIEELEGAMKLGAIGHRLFAMSLCNPHELE